MDGIFGIGPLEIVLVFVLALILLGPQDMVRIARQLGRSLYRLYHSPVWRQIMSTQQELRDLPNKFVREAGLEETIASLKKDQAAIQADIRQVTGAATAELNAATQEIKGQPPAALATADPPVDPPDDPPDPPDSDNPDEFSI
jgi:Sec-independent protein translocase protein TatA